MSYLYRTFGIFKHNETCIISCTITIHTIFMIYDFHIWAGTWKSTSIYKTLYFLKFNTYSYPLYMHTYCGKKVEYISMVKKLIIYLHSRTWRFTWAVSNCDGSHVYVPESESWAFFIVSVLIVVPSAICSGGVVWSLLPPIAVNLFLCLEWGI